MASPSRAQITATIALPTYLVEVDTGAGYSAISGIEVRSIDTKIETTSNVDNAFAFGTVAKASTTVAIADTTTITNWQLAKIRVQYGFDTSDTVVAFEGVIVKRQHQGHFYTYECQGFDYLIQRKKIYTGVFYRRPIATKTTVTSIEDITDGNYRGGLLNYIMWSSGGRPYEQPGYVTDPDFKFWYSFDQSIITPRYSWISGDNAWEEVYRLVSAAGGQLYQDKDGVFYYKQPLTFGFTDGIGLYHFDESTYQQITEDASTVENFDTIKAPYIERVLQPMQDVYDSSTPTLLPNGETTSVPLELQYPVYSFASYVTTTGLLSNGSAIKATFLDGRNATTDVDLTIPFIIQAAQILTIDFDNATGEPIALNKVIIQGRPIMAGSEGVATYTNGTGAELQVEDNIYIQSITQAERIVRMLYDFYHTNRAIITLDGVGYDPDRYLGEVVELSNDDWSIDHDRYRIISLEYQNGAKMSVKLAPVEGLVTRDDVFIVATTYSDGTTKEVSY
jgi:hypothetical protein